MPQPPTPDATATEATALAAVAVVQAQLDAYNSKDIEALLGTYAPDAQQFALHGAMLAQGHDQMRPRFLERFREPDLHARLLSRTVMLQPAGAVVVDHECVERNFPEGRGTLDMLCVYELADGCIQKASFAPGVKSLNAL